MKRTHFHRVLCANKNDGNLTKLTKQIQRKYAGMLYARCVVCAVYAVNVESMLFSQFRTSVEYRTL